MSTVEIRAEIDNFLNIVEQEDASLLKAVHAMLGTYVKANEKDLVGYRTDTHEPVYKNELAAELDAAVAQVEAGDFITLEELEEEVKTW